MSKGHAIGTKMMVTVNGKTEEWTKLDEETWNTAGGTEGMAWVSCERPDMERDLREARKEMARAEREAAAGNQDPEWDLASCRADLAYAEEAVRLMDLFFPR